MRDVAITCRITPQWWFYAEPPNIFRLILTTRSALFYIKNQIMNDYRKDFLNGIVIILFLITIIKMLVVVFSNPIIGYANNFDFLRQSSCIGLWQNYQDRPKTSANLERPINKLIYDKDINNEHCMRSIDNIFPYVAILFHNIGDTLDFREISFWKLAFIIFFTITMLFQISLPEVRVSIMLAFLFIFGDFYNILYFNTLYLEFSVISGLFLTLSMGVWLSVSPNKPTASTIVISIIFLTFLALGKQQYSPMASILSLFYAVIIFKRWKIKKTTFLLIGLIVLLPIAFSALNRDNRGIMRWVSFANKTDTFLGAVLPESNDKISTLNKLGLPNSCLQGVGKDWYNPDVQRHHPCPEIEKISRLSLIKLFIAEPKTFFNPMYKAILNTKLFNKDYGKFENSENSKLLEYEIIIETSLTTLLALIPFFSYAIVVILSMILGLITTILWIYFLKRSNSIIQTSAIAMFSLGGITIIYSIASSVFGDGYADVAKHSVGFPIGLSFQMSGLITILIYKIRTACSCGLIDKMRSS